MKIFILFLLGITIIFNTESNSGFIYINRSPVDATYILQPSLNRVTMYDSDNNSYIITYTIFLKIFKEINKEFTEDNIRAIIMPFAKEPKIIY